jgi:hypothetical protein
MSFSFASAITHGEVGKIYGTNANFERIIY